MESDSFKEVAAASEPVVSGEWRVLRDPELAEVVQGAMLHFQGRRYLLSSWCVMPSHVHAVVTPLADWTVSRVLHSWKSYSAHRINEMLGRSGPVWQAETFDHLIRNWESFQRFVAYTEGNPVAAGLCRTMEEWPFSSARFRSRDG